MKEKLDAIKQKALEKLSQVTDLDGLNEIRVEFLGKKGDKYGTWRKSLCKRSNKQCSGLFAQLRYLSSLVAVGSVAFVEYRGDGGGVADNNFGWQGKPRLG